MNAHRKPFLRHLAVLGATSALLYGAAPLLAQDTPAANTGTPTAPNAAPARNLILVEAEQLAVLPTLLGRAGAISLQVDQQTLDNSPAARDALLDWVAKGGVVFLHTDAARLFGYQTVSARLATPRQAGQLYGRARAAIPFATHPLLWDDGRARRVNVSRLPGVNVVYYTMREGDQLVVSHPAGTPLLQVTDLAAPTDRDLYASAVAPFGKGLAIFTPDYVDQQRGDGAAFVRNLLGLLPGTDGRSRWVAISQNAVEQGAAALQAELTAATAPPTAPALPAFGTVGENENQQTAPVPAAPPNPTAPAVPRVTSPVLLLSRNEATAALNALQAGRGATVVAVLRARVSLLRGDYDLARQAIEAARQVAPNSLEVALLDASLISVGVTNRALAALERAQTAQNVAQVLNVAASAPALLAVSNAAGAPNPAGLTGQQIQGWAGGFQALAQTLATEPPLAQAVGGGDDTIVVRYFPGDTNAPLVASAANALITSQAFGWRPDGLEILLFPTEETYVAYRAAAQLNTQNVPFPAGGAGDVAGDRILLASIPVAPVPQRLPNGQVRVLPPRSITLEVLARLYAYSLMTAYLDGTQRIPAWMPLGLENLSKQAIIGDVQTAEREQTLDRFAQAGALLNPQQFQGGNVASDVAVAQAASMVEFFYRTYGVGAFVETVQRLGAGENIDAALEATTGETQESFFNAWSDARFGPRNLP